LFRGINDGHLDPIETVLERHDLALVAWHEGQAELHGAVTDDERDLWELVRADGPLGSSQAAAWLNAPPDEAERQLDSLCRRRLIMRHDAGYVVPGCHLPAS